jgi:hypothetical protein
VEDAHVKRESRRQQGIVDALPQLAEARVTPADSNPDHASRPAGREDSDAAQRQQKRFDPHLGERRVDSIAERGVNVTEDPDCQVKLIDARPGDVSARLVQRGQFIAERNRQGNRDKLSLGWHGNRAS